MKKFYILLSLVTILIAACSKDNDQPARKERNYNVFHHRLSDGNRVNIFQKVRFRLGYGEEQYFKDAAENINDSVIWKIEGTKHMLRFDKSNAALITDAGFEYLFIRPGHYRSIMEWYHYRELIHSDTLDIEVVNEKPFMNYAFNSDVYEQISNPVDDYLTWVFSLQLSDEPPYKSQGLKNIFVMSVFIDKWSQMDDEYFLTLRKTLNDQITVLYGNPTYTKESCDIDGVFKDFYGIDNAYYEYYVTNDPHISIHPEAIWLSPTCYITLMRIHHIAEDWIIASWDPDAYPHPVHDEYVIWAKERK